MTRNTRILILVAVAVLSATAALIPFPHGTDRMTVRKWLSITPHQQYLYLARCPFLKTRQAAKDGIDTQWWVIAEMRSITRVAQFEVGDPAYDPNRIKDESLVRMLDAASHAHLKSVCAYINPKSTK